MKRWKEYFEDLYNTTHNNNEDSNIKKNRGDTKGEKISNFTEEEIKEAIKSLKPRQSPGTDRITTEMLQAGEELTVEIFKNLCNKIFEEEKSPEEWGKAIIVPIHKKGDKTNCSNYRGISLLSIPGKIYTKALQQRLKHYMEEILAEEQAGFRMGRSTIDQIHTIRRIVEKYCETNKKIYHNFIDFKQAFDSIKHEELWQALRHYGIPEKLVKLIKNLYSKTMSSVKINGELTEWFEITIGTRQGCGLSPLLFNIILEVVMQKALQNVEEENAGIKIYGQTINNLRFADDIDVMATKAEHLQTLTNEISKAGEEVGLKINIQKTKAMVTGNKKGKINLKLKDEEIEQVTKFVYLGSVMTEDGLSEEDIRRRIGLTSAAFGKLWNIWKDKQISIKTKLKLYNTLIKPILLYGSECWTIKKKDERRLMTAEMNWLRGISGVSRKQRIRNTMIREKTGQKETIIESIQKRRLKWFGHVERMKEERLPKKALYNYVEGKRRKGRPRKTWIENLKEDAEEMQMNLIQLTEAARDRQKWKELIQTHRPTQ